MTPTFPNSGRPSAPQPAGRSSGATLFGVPMGDLGWFASLLMGLASGFVAFFLGTFLGIVGIMILNSAGHPTDYSLSYRRVGLPLGIGVGALALLYLGTLWVRRITRSN